MVMSDGVSVVIVNWNTADLLEACLESVFSTIQAHRDQVIVVDNGSSDRSVAMLEEKFGQVDLVRNPSNLGFTRATNQGYARAETQYVLCLNSDTVVTPGAIEDTRAFLDDHPEVAVAGCRLTYPDGRPQPSCFRFPCLLEIALLALYLPQLFPRSPVFNWGRYGQQVWDEPHPVDCVMGSFMMVRRSAVGPQLFDEGYFMYAEEADLCRRMVESGARVMYYPDAVVEHHHGGSVRNPRVPAWAYEAKRRALLRFIRKWDGAFKAYLANVVTLLGLLPRAAGWLLADVLSYRPGSPARWARVRKAGSLRFHLTALVDPARLDSDWTPTRTD